MASKNITFDPDAGVPKGVNLTIHTGADFTTNFNVVDTSNAVFNFTGYSGSAQMAKSVAVGATLGVTTSFTVGFTSAYDGKLKISLGAVNTRATSEGRYVYDVLLKHEVGGGSTVHPLISGNILVVNPVSSAP